VDVRGITLLIAHPEDLIRMKTVAAQYRDRPEIKRRQDLDDIAILNRVLEVGSDQARDKHVPTARPYSSPPTRPGPSR
jgi:hypothetical protein